MNDSTKILSVENLSVNYGTVEALRYVSFHINEGEIVALLGPNGAGKSTCLKALSGLLPSMDGRIVSGEIKFMGKSVKGMQPYDLVKKGISLVPEGRRVFNTMTVEENLEMGAYSMNKERYNLQNKLKSIYNIFPILEDRKKQKAGTLSSGEQQMLALARALMLEPKLLLLDEPSLGLSPNYVNIVFNKIKEINSMGTTILLVEQNVRKALKYSDRAYIFKIGEIAVEGRSKELLKKNVLEEAFLK